MSKDVQCPNFPPKKLGVWLGDIASELPGPERDSQQDDDHPFPSVSLTVGPKRGEESEAGQAAGRWGFFGASFPYFFHTTNEKGT